MVAINQLFTSISRNNLLIIFISALLISAFILPNNLMDVFSSGPILWVKLIIATILISFPIRYDSKPILSCFNSTDALVLFGLVYIFLQKLILNLHSQKFIIYSLLITTYYIVKFSFSSISSLEKKISYLTITTAVSLIAFVGSIVGIGQIVNLIPSNSPYFRVTGNFKNPARYATYLSSLFPAPFCFYTIYKTNVNRIKKLRVIAGISLIAGLFVFPSTYSRSSWVGLAVMILLVIYLKYKVSLVKKFKSFSPLVLIGSIAFIILCFLFLYFLKPQSANSRLSVWTISFPMFLDHPILGIGYGQFEYQYDNYQALYFSSRNNISESRIYSSDVIRYPYNVFLQVLFEQGLLGLTLFLLILFKSIPYYLFKPAYIITNKDIVTISSFMVIITILVGGLTSYPFDILPVHVIFYIHLALLSCNNYNKPGSRFFLRKNATLFINLTLFFFGFILMITAFQEFKAYRLWKIAEENPTKIQNIEPIYSALSDNPDFLEFYTARLLNNREYEKLINTCHKMNSLLMYPSFYIYLAQSFSAKGLYHEAEKNYLFATNMIPNRFYPQYLLDKFYYDHHNYSAAIVVSKRILNMKIKVPSKTVDLILDKAKIILTDSNRQLIKRNN